MVWGGFGSFALQTVSLIKLYAITLLKSRLNKTALIGNPITGGQKKKNP